MEVIDIGCPEKFNREESAGMGGGGRYRRSWVRKGRCSMPVEA